MARKTKQRKPIADLLIDAAMELAADMGWHPLSMAAIAQQAEVPLAEALQTFTNKSRVLAAIARRIDAAVLEGASAKWDDTESPRDRLFDILMRRFDALQPYKPGLRRTIPDLPRDPLVAACHLGRILNSMRLALEMAGISAAGIAGGIKAKALAAIYVNALRVWLDDDTPDLATTMAALDRGLMQAEKLAIAVSKAANEKAPDDMPARV